MHELQTSDTETKLRQTAKELFESGKIDVLVGYTKGTLPLRSRPIFITNVAGVDKLVWNAYCSNNLAVYLPRFFPAQPQRKTDEILLPKVGIIVKGCDMRSAVGVIKEKQAPRENVVMVGVHCMGMIDLVKVEELTGGERVNRCDETPDGKLVVSTRLNNDQSIEKEQVIADACLDCQHPTPDGADVIIEGKSRKAIGEKYGAVDKFEAISAKERWQYFKQEISRCIRCYACRQACPNCYCKVCFADQTKPRWIGAGTELSDVMLYHIGRIFHQAGRCVECDACLRACPMNIDLRTFTQKLAKDVKELFEFTPGLSFEEPPPLCTFRDDDNQDFITEP